MANYATLKTAIQQVVKTNGNNEITGALLQQSLLAMIDSLGAYYQFAGVATPSTNPGTPDQNVFYLAGAGTYPNMDGYVINSGEIGVLRYNGTWHNSKIKLADIVTDVFTNDATTYNADGSVYFSRIYTKKNGVNGISSININYTVSPISGACFFVLNGNQIYVRTISDILGDDIILLALNSSHIVFGGALYADYIKKANPLYFAPVVYAAKSCAYNDDGSIYISTLRIKNGNTGQFQEFAINSTIQPLSAATTYFVLTSNGTVQAKAEADVLATDVLLISRLRQSSGGDITGGILYPDYVNKKNISIPNLIVEVIPHVNNRYNPDGSIYFYILYVKKYNISGITSIQIGQTFQPITGASFFVLNASNQIEVKAISDIAAGDYVLIAMNAAHVVIGGALYADYINKTQSQPSGQNYFNGKKMVANGDSIMYGTTVTDRTKVFPIIAGDALGMTVINYAIGGSTVAKRASDYDDVFLNYTDWQAAITAGTLDTAKKYLVKDNLHVPVRPYDIYSYDGTQWVAGGNASYQVGRTPLVDRIPEMDTDADVVLISIGSNDWAYEWTNFGNDASRQKTDFNGALHLLCQYLVTTYPGKLILFITPPFSWRYQPLGVSQATWNITTWDAQSPNLQKTWWDYADTMRQILKQYGIPLFDMGVELGFSQQNRWWCGDTDGKYVHPGENAQPYIAELLCAELLTHKYPVE